MTVTRRQALTTLGLAPLGLAAPCFAKPRERLPVAAVVTSYFKNSHADVLVGKILEGWRQQGGPGPDLELVSLYADQVPSQDLSRDLARKHGFRIAKTIDEAITLNGDELAVAGVLNVGEHGNYPLTDTQQRMYPRRRLFDDAVAAMRRCGKFVPMFNDKHLAWNWRDAKHMYDTAQRHQIALLAGSSLPVAWRYPAVELPKGSQLQEALAVGYGGLESYGFHALEALQCMVERRRGGESGVAAVTAVQGEQIWQAERQGRWSRDLLEAAVATFKGSIERLEQRLKDKAAFYLIEYRDGLRATVAMLNGVAGQMSVACKLRQQADPLACWFRLEERRPFGHFEHLLRAIEHTVHTGQTAYPVERTLLTTGILDRVMNSLHQGGKRLATPELAVAYQPSDWAFANRERENFPAQGD